METKETVARRANELFARHRQEIYRNTIAGRLAAMMRFPWFAEIVAALWISPRPRIGLDSRIHVHLSANTGMAVAMPTHERPCKPACPIAKALAAIPAQSGRRFEPKKVEAFLTPPHEALV